MMKKFFSTLLVLLSSYGSFAQINEPQILILTPFELSYDKSFASEVKKADKEQAAFYKKNHDQMQQTIRSADFKEEPQNVQTMALSEVQFTKEMNFSKQVSLIAQRYLSYRFYEHFPNELILLSERKMQSTALELGQLAAKEKMQYILNFSKVELFKRGGVSYAKIAAELYDNETKTFLMTRTFEGDWENHGFEFACEEKTIDCTISNALAKTLKDVIYLIASNSPTIKREKELAQQRFDALMANYYNQPVDKNFLTTIIPQPDSTIVLKDVYQVMIDPTKKKFIAFFIEQTTQQDFKQMKDSKKDRSIDIISSKEIGDEGFLDEMPKQYAYIVKGVQYKDKWYFMKSNVTYFDAKNSEEGKRKYFDNLQRWGFFKNDSAIFDPDFWETHVFKKVPDLTLDPDWPKYKESMWKTDEIKNRPYIGLYEIVADGLREEEKNKNEKFDQSVSVSTLLPFYDKQVKTKPNEFQSYVMMYKKLTLIYPQERNVVLNPILIKNGKGENYLHYFLVWTDSNKIYEWTYFKPLLLPEKAWHYGSNVVDQLGKVTTWNFSMTTLDDKNFWDNMVWKKNGNQYLYLTPVE